MKLSGNVRLSFEGESQEHNTGLGPYFEKKEKYPDLPKGSTRSKASSIQKRVL